MLDGRERITRRRLDRFELEQPTSVATSTSASGRSKPATAKLEEGPFKVEATLTGVFEDDSTEKPAHYVYLASLDKDGHYPRRTVKTGKSAGGKTEILEGLAEREEVLTSRP